MVFACVCDAPSATRAAIAKTKTNFPIDLAKQEERAGIGLTPSRAWRMARLSGCASPVGKPSLGNPNYLNAPVSPTGRYDSGVFPQPETEGTRCVLKNSQILWERMERATRVRTGDCPAWNRRVLVGGIMYLTGPRDCRAAPSVSVGVSLSGDAQSCSPTLNLSSRGPEIGS